MKIGSKVTIKDGSYMMTVNNGRATHTGAYSSTEVIGWNKEKWTVIHIGGLFPKDTERHDIINDTMIVNDENGEVWFCSHLNIREAGGRFKKGDWVIVKNTGTLCATHPELSKYIGGAEGLKPNITRPLCVIEYKHLNYINAVVCSQGENIFIFSSDEDFMRVQRPLPSSKKEIEELLELYLAQNDGLPFQTSGIDFLREQGY